MKIRSDALAIEQAAKIADCSRRFLDKAIARGELPSVKIPTRRGRHIMPEDLARFLRPRVVESK